MKYTYIIWDWNGTIVDDAQLCVDIVNQHLKNFKIKEVSLDYYLNNFRFPVSSYYDQVGLPTDLESLNKISSEFINKYRKLYKVCNIHSGANACFEKLRSVGIYQSVLSASMESDLLSFILHFKLDHYFENISGVGDFFASGKSNISHDHLKKLNTDKSKVLLIGDTLHDAEIAQNLEIDCLLFSGGHNSVEILTESDFPIVGTFDEICNYVLD